MKRLFGCFVLMCCWISFSQAHEVRPAFLKVTETNLETDRSEFEISFRQPQINGRFLGLSVSTNCDATELSASLTDGALTEVFALECEEESLQYIEVDGLDRTLIDTLVNIKRLDGSINEILINGNEPRLDLTVATPTVPVYLIIGIEHLLLGFDHILFVIMLLYLVRSSWQILKVVTSFTIAHSLTLALSALELVQLSSAPVAAVNAGCIVLLAYENLQKKCSVSKTFPVLIAFGFGLLHGLGFAGAVAEIGLPEESQLIALLLFNIGIELGQLAIIAFVLLLLMVMRLKFIRLLYEVPIYLTGGIASFWFLQRSWQILAPGIG